MTQQLPSFEKQLRAYLTDVSDFDIKRIITLHEMNRGVTERVVEKTVIQVREVEIETLCPACKRSHKEIKALVTPDRIEDVVVEVTGVCRNKLRSRTRKRTVTVPRHIIMYLARQHAYEYLSTIGKRYNRDHTTVINAVNTIKDLLDTDDHTRSLVHEIETRLFK